MTFNPFRTWLFSFSLLLMYISLAGCGSLPRIIIVKDPLTIEERLRLGSIYESRGELDNAIEEYQKALSIDKRDPEALFFLGNAYFSKNDLKKSEFFYKKALDAGDEYQKKGMVYNNLAWIYIKRNLRLEEAERLSKKAIILDPANSPIYLDTLGVIYITMKEYARAEQVLLESLEQTSSAEDQALLSETLTHLSEVYRAMGLDEKAKEAIERANEHKGYED